MLIKKSCLPKDSFFNSFSITMQGQHTREPYVVEKKLNFFKYWYTTYININVFRWFFPITKKST